MLLMTQRETCSPTCSVMSGCQSLQHCHWAHRLVKACAPPYSETLHSWKQISSVDRCTNCIDILVDHRLVYASHVQVSKCHTLAQRHSGFKAQEKWIEDIESSPGDVGEE
ncbi:hypothetical protein BU25DRAFT_20691 [Macroventuria anomochaeta]|uniref:Uncharacterized protein n=1 Tax=Macroventuria anomochaeta TaxID=301207 RepID=A0ACB6S7L9_9PLEO|nr:uncharacterized protein BU25DRAFT_20691 [Macroventuria anomochaeta]KAF2629354.1 hypothetical protein BU25DRAFT_20691 [Macroventuria anomochaeta]